MRMRKEATLVNRNAHGPRDHTRLGDAQAFIALKVTKKGRPFRWDYCVPRFRGPVSCPVGEGFKTHEKMIEATDSNYFGEKSGSGSGQAPSSCGGERGVLEPANYGKVL